MDQPPQRVPAEELRRLFNNTRIVERAKAGELDIRIRFERVVRDDHPFEPAGTRSMAIAYYTKDGRRIAVAHQFLRPDGTVGGSGLPDPKWLLLDGQTYIVGGGAGTLR